MQVIHAVEIGVRQFAHFGFNITRDGNIYQQHRLITAGFQRTLHHPFTDNRQRTGGRTDNNIRLFQAFIDVAQRNDLCAHFVREHLRTLAGAVGDNHLFHFMLAQMARHKFDGFARAHQQHGDGRQGFKDLTSEGTGRESNRNRTGTNVGFGSHSLCHGERLLEHTLQLAGLQMPFLRIRKRLFHLPKNLRFAQHQRIQPAGHAHEMADRIVVLMPVQAIAQFFFIEVVVVA